MQLYSSRKLTKREVYLKYNTNKETQYDSQLLSQSILSQTIPELLQNNDDEYQMLKRRILDREQSGIKFNQYTLKLNHNICSTYDLHNDTIQQLQEQMSKSVRTALFGQDEEMEVLLKETRERFMKEKEFLKDKDTIDREIKLQDKKRELGKVQELQQLQTERDILQERYENFISQVNEIINSKTGMRGKENLERLIALRKIKDSIENDRARIMSMVFQIQTGDFSNTRYRQNQSGIIAAQNILNSSQSQPQIQTQQTYNQQPAYPDQQSYLQYWNIPDESNIQPSYDPQQIQLDSSQIDRNLETANRLGSEIKMWMQGLDPALQKYAETNGTSVFDMMFSDRKEDYASMSQEEKRLINLLAQEADARRALQRIPQNTPLYNQKVQQVNQIAMMRSDLEKTVQEQKYTKIRETYERTNREDDDKERTKRIRTRLVSQMEGWRGERKYQPEEGLVIHWDWVLNVPKRYEKCRLTWGIFLKGQTLSKPSIIEDRICISEGYRNNSCMLNQHNFVYDIISNKDIILVIELQCYHRDPESSKRKLDIYGWTIHELFDLNQTLIRGKFKLPFYPTNTNPSALISSEKPLKSVSNTLLFIRISFPFDQEYSKGEPLDPSHLTQDYYLTGIHSRTIIRADNDHIKQPVRKRGYNPLAFDELFNLKKEIIEEEKEEIVEEQEDDWKFREPGDQRRGLYVNIHELLNYFTKSKTKIRCFLTDVRRGVIKDEKGVPCSFETDPYESYDQAMRGKTQFRDAVLNGPFVFFEEEYQFFVDIDTYAHNNKAWDDLYLIFQVLDEYYEDVEEKKNPDDSGEQQESLNDSMNESKSQMTTKTVKYKGSKWYSFKLFQNNSMKTGRFQEFVYDPPIKKPPFDPIEVRTTQHQIDFTVNFFDYDMRYLDDQMEKFKMLRMLRRKQRGKEKEKKKKPVKQPKKEEKFMYDWEKLPISDRPFIENHKKLYHDRPFEKGFGIDFYIDQARFLPDNTTLCKIIVQFMNCNLEQIFPPKSVLPDIKTSTYSPFFNYKQELRSPHFDPTLLILLTILTVDNTNKEVRIVGYAGINLFLSRSTRKQPTLISDTDIIMMDGAYQLPLYCQHPNLMKPFNIERLNKLDRLQCSTILVRTILAPMSDDGLKPLSINDFSQKDWDAKGVMQRMPPYGTGYYNTELCLIRDIEKDLYNVRVQRQDPPQTEIVARLLSYENVHKQMTIAETLTWLDTKLVRDAYTDIIELTYFAKYKPQVGFKFSLDGFHNVPDTDNAYVAIYSINPPGRLYLEMGFDLRDIITCTSFNWESALNSPQYNEGYFKFKDIPFQKNTQVIIDVRKIIFSERKTKARIEKVGWTIMPIFTQNGSFVKSGIYQLPIFAGQVPIELVKEMQRGDPWELIEDKLKLKKGGLKYVDAMSAIVRLLDGQREGHFQTSFDHTRMVWTYLPQNRMSSYVYNAGVDAKLKSATKLMKLAPNKEKLNEFNEQITKTLYGSLGLKPDQMESGRQQEQLQQQQQQ